MALHVLLNELDLLAAELLPREVRALQQVSEHTCRQN